MLPSLLLQRRRPEDYPGDDLWSAFNVVQENLTQGGVQGLTQGRRSTRAIQAVPSLVQVNQGLWAASRRDLQRTHGNQSVIAQIVQIITERGTYERDAPAPLPWGVMFVVLAFWLVLTVMVYIKRRWKK